MRHDCTVSLFLFCPICCFFEEKYRASVTLISILTNASPSPNPCTLTALPCTTGINNTALSNDGHSCVCQSGYYGDVSVSSDIDAHLLFGVPCTLCPHPTGSTGGWVCTGTGDVNFAACEAGFDKVASGSGYVCTRMCPPFSVHRRFFPCALL